MCCPCLWLGSLQFRWGQTPALCLMRARKAGTKLSAKGAGSSVVVVALPPAHCWPPSGSLQGEARWGESSPVQPWLLIGYGAPQCPPPASPSPAGAATLVVVANAARSSGHSCASQRPASPTRSQTPQLRAPDPSPPTHPPAQSPAAQSPWLLHPPAARTSPPRPPHPPGLCPLGQAHSAGAQAPAHGHSRSQGGSSERGRQQGGQGEGELVLLLLVNAPRAGAKNRGGEIFRQSQDAFGRREGEREREEGRREGGKRERGERKRGPQFPNPCSRSRGGTAPGVGPRADPALGVTGSGPQRQPNTPTGQARTDTGRSQDQCTLGRQREACGRPKHIPAPPHTTGFCP